MTPQVRLYIFLSVDFTSSADYSDEEMDVDSEPDATVLSGTAAWKDDYGFGVNTVESSAETNIEEGIEECNDVNEDIGTSHLL
jgi:hypothetical protein